MCGFISVPLIDWISDTLSQGYINLQSLVKCLGHRSIVSDAVCSQAKVVLGCAILEMHLGGHCYNRVELLTSKGAEKSTVAYATDCEVEADSLTAGHECKHNTCRAESEVALVVIPISAE